MKKKVTSVNTSKKRTMIILSVTAVFAITSLAGIIDKELKEQSKNTDTLNYFLKTYGYENPEDMNLNAAGYYLGYENSYYQINYDLNTKEEATPTSTLYNNLKETYQGEDVKDFQKGLKDGIDDGSKEAMKEYKDNSKTRIK